MPYAPTADPVWLRPTLSPWIVARANLERLSGAGQRIVLLSAERSLDAPDSPDAARLIGHGVFFALSLAGLRGEFGGAIQARAAALLTAPGAHLLVSLAPDKSAQEAAWAAFEPEIYGLTPADVTRLTESNWLRIASGQPAEPVCAIAPRAGFFTRALGRDKVRRAPAGDAKL